MTRNFGIYTDMYNSIISDLESGKFLPNMKAIRQQIREAKKINRYFNERFYILPEP